MPNIQLFAWLAVMCCCSHMTLAVFTTRRPWCFNGHLHINALREGKTYMGLENDDDFTEVHLNRKINDSFHRVGCDLLDNTAIDCCQSMTADNIYTVLDIAPGEPLSQETYMQSSIIITSWMYQLEEKCSESKSMNWSSLAYKDFVHDIMDSFHDHEHDDDDPEQNNESDDEHEHEEEHFTAVALENLIRAIDEHYIPGDEGYAIETNKTDICSAPDAWHVMSRDIWRDLHLEHEDEGISEDEMDEMGANLLLYILHGYCFIPDRIVEDQLPPTSDFIKYLFLEFGDEETCTIDEHGFDEILELLNIEGDDHEPHSTTTQSQGHDAITPLEDHEHEHDSPYGDPVSERCLDSHDLQETFHIDLHHHDLSLDDFLSLCPALIQQSIQGCKNQHSHAGGTPPTDAEKYGFGTLAVLVISVFALLGLVVVRWNKTAAYKYIITTMLGLAAGSLVGDTLLHLIPHALELHDHSHDDHDHSNDISDLQVEPYIWKMLCACASVWVFFLLQVALINANDIFLKKSMNIDVMETEVESQQKVQINGTTNKAFDKSDEPQLVHMTPIAEVVVKDGGTPQKVPDHEDTTKTKTPQEVAWMAIVGDSIHNLADGLTIGAAFSADLALGLSTSIAVLCHEIPHEFGDVAIMLSAGWSIKKVALLQFISACFAFVGLFIGVPVASNEEARHWIFIIAAGMFLYVALCNVIPELISMYQDGKKKGIFLAANVGFVLGVVFMLLLAIFEEYITI